VIAQAENWFTVACPKEIRNPSSNPTGGNHYRRLPPPLRARQPAGNDARAKLLLRRLGLLQPTHDARTSGLPRRAAVRRTADATCGEKSWEADLKSVDAPWFDQPTAVLVCGDCLADAEDAEERYEDFNAGETPRGQLEMGLAMV